MAIVRPFQALRPVRERASDVAAVPYDVVTTEEARSLASTRPWSFLHVSRAEIDLPNGADPYSPAVYRKAAENFERLSRDCPLIRESEPCLYLYRLRSSDHEQTGVAAAFSVDEYDSDVIRKHERTRRDKEDDRTRHIIALRAQTGPVFLTYRDRREIDDLVAAAAADEPLYDFHAEDGVEHTIWRLDADRTRRLAVAFDEVPLLYIADGHHRAASASRARDEFHERSDRAGGHAEYDFFLGVAFPAGQVRILPYNRLVKDLGSRSPEEFLSALKEKLPVATNAPPTPVRRGDASMYLGGRWYGLRFSFGEPSSGTLDVTLLQESVFEPLLGVGDVRTDKRVDFVGGGRGTAALEKAVDEGRAAVAFSLYPVDVADLMRIADVNEIMPPKSTWFEPKLRDGLLIHEI
ncbi:MAG TPA: DUF1015 family protein [Thermoanaerobaculia bacterium]|nr:DUF1015 family protein [Thermoanaerobaculia bacterium]